MPAIDFPSSPTTNQTYTFNGRTWTYNGTAWVATTSGPDAVTMGKAIAAAIVFG